MTTDYRIMAHGDDITGRPIRAVVTTDDRTLALDLTRFLAAQRLLRVTLVERTARTLSERDGTALHRVLHDLPDLVDSGGQD